MEAFAVGEDISKSRMFVGKLKFKSIAKVGRIRGVYYSSKIEVEDKS